MSVSLKYDTRIFILHEQNVKIAFSIKYGM